ncbi:MAG: EamA family transporter [Deltaproteobacteria bacterium]|nr:EamA family transporter [Deltaproteobacteria bacterium]MBW2087049.1 EamA family transporter [Deltaproteobacteria bacterium]
MGLKRNKELGAYIALGVAIIFWGFSFVATKVALRGFSTFTLIFARFGLAAVLFLILLAWRGFPRFTRKDHARVLLTAFFEPGLYFIFETIGLQYTTAPKAALIIATIPIMVLALAFFLLGERTRLASLAGISISVIGIAILIMGGPEFIWALGSHLFGDLLIFGAVISASFYIILARSLGQKYSAFEITSMQTIYGALFYIPAFLWELPGLQWSAIHGASLWALVYLTFFATIGAFLCFNHALTKVPAPRAAVFINGIPVVTALAAWVWLGERLSVMQAGGGALILFGVLLTNLTRSQAVERAR